MKQLMKLGSLVAVASAFVTTTVFAQTNTFSFDENGNGTFNGLVVPGGLVAADPSGGVAGPVLIYTLPAVVPQLTIGDVVLLETINPTNISDVIRFWEFNQVIFYSDRETGSSGDSDPADMSGLPSFLLANQAVMPEVGVEGNNGANYHALPGQPGWDGSPLGTQFKLISDVPEPGSIALSTLGGGLLLLVRWRRQARR